MFCCTCSTRLLMWSMLICENMTAEMTQLWFISDSMCLDRERSFSTEKKKRKKKKNNSLRWFNTKITCDPIMDVLCERIEVEFKLLYFLMVKRNWIVHANFPTKNVLFVLSVMFKMNKEVWPSLQKSMSSGIRQQWGK